MASKIKNLKLLENLFGDRLDVILNFLEKENVKIKNRSTNFVSNISNLIFNYIDFIHNGDCSIIKDKSIAEIEKEYSEWFLLNKSARTIPKDLNVIYDYRKNNLGYFWVNLNSHYSSEMMFNMDNCGRVGANQNLILLIEQLVNNQFEMCVAVVISKDGYIIQIKGKNNTKPTLFYSQIFDFFLKYEPILGFKRIFKPENDFTTFDLNKDDIEKLRLVKPHLFDKFL